MTTAYELDRAADHLPPAYLWSMHEPTGLRFHDSFCGAGGSSLGLTGAGMELVFAINHWDRAIETHSANFRDADHRCVDMTHFDLRLMPRAEIGWFSPICTEASPAGGNTAAAAQEELELFGPVAKAGMERTRATFWEVLRATELHRYQAVIVENVVEVASRWRLFDHWVAGMEFLDYEVQFVSVSAAHIGAEDNPYAPQWRDRLWMVFTRKGAPLPDVEPRPLAHCFTCGVDVHAVQSWKKPGRKIGKYRQQYTYVCPRRECRHQPVEPYVLPAAAVIDWSNLGTRVGDRKRPLAAKTLARIRAGLEMYRQPITAEVAGNTFERRPGVRTWPAHDAPLTTQTTTSTKAIVSPPVLIHTNHDDGDTRAMPVHAGPLPTRSTKIGEGIAQVPDGAFLDVARTHNRPRSVDEPISPLTTGRNHALVVPAGGTWRDSAHATDKPFGARTTRDTDALVCPPLLVEHRRNGEARPAFDEPTSTITAGDLRGGSHHSILVPPGALAAQPRMGLVIPFRRGARPYGAGQQPISTVATRDQHGLAHLGVDVQDCLFRMLTPDEHLAAQRFHPSYVVLGNKGERTMQAGNAVPSNVAQWLGAAVVVALCGDVRAA